MPTETLTYLGIIAAGIIVRQADRWWFSPARGRHRVQTLQQVMALQRARSNDVTPGLLLAGHWLEIVGWWGLAVHAGPAGWAAVSVAMAIKFRHLQEVSHFAVHGVLTPHRPCRGGAGRGRRPRPTRVRAGARPP